MPLSRLTQTLPLDWAAAISGEETAPVLAALGVELFSGAGLGAVVAGVVEAEEEELGAAVELDLGAATLPLSDFLVLRRLLDVLSLPELSDPVG
jgi:hypothetical protein